MIDFQKYNSHICIMNVPFSVVPKTVPYEECRAVPAVDCYFVLKTVDDLECTPVRYNINWLPCCQSVKYLP